MPRPACQHIVRCFCVAGLLASLGFGFSSSSVNAQNSSRPATSKPIDGHAVLTARGLSRTGKLYLLPSELAARDKIKAGSEAFKRIETEAETLRQSIFQAQTRQAGLNDQVLSLQTQREGLNAQRQQYSLALAGANNDPTYRNQVRLQIQQIDTQLQYLQDSLAQTRQIMILADQRIQDQMASLRGLRPSMRPSGPSSSEASRP